MLKARGRAFVTKIDGRTETRLFIFFLRKNGLQTAHVTQLGPGGTNVSMISTSSRMSEGKDFKSQRMR